MLIGVNFRSISALAFYRRGCLKLLNFSINFDLKMNHDPEEIELFLRDRGLDYCGRCGQAISGREISSERVERWLGGKEKPMCRRCRLIIRRRKILIFIIAPPIVFLSYLILIFFNVVIRSLEVLGGNKSYCSASSTDLSALP